MGDKEQREVLKDYLYQYNRALKRKYQLELRLKNFRENMLGVKAVQYSATRSNINSISDEPASVVIRHEEILEEIIAQKKDMMNILLSVMNLIDYLPRESMERSVIEYRHIDCLNWAEIIQEMHISRTTANGYYNAGIDKLLTYKKVRVLIEKQAEDRA